MVLGDSNANEMIMPVAPTGAFGNNGMGGDWAWMETMNMM